MPAPGKGRARGWLASLAVFTVVLAAFLGHRYASAGTLYFTHPHEAAGVQLYLPCQLASAALWGEGLPTWNPWSGCGTPHMANLQSSVLYPLNALFLLLPPIAAAEALVVLRLLAVGIGCLAFGRSLGLSAGGALFLALGFGLNSWEQRYANDGLLNGDLLLPWLAMAYLRLGATGRVMPGVAAVVLTALHVFSGMPENSFFSFGFVALLFLHAAFASPDRVAWGGGTKKLAVLGVVLCAGAALAAVQVLPFLEYLRHAWSPHLDEGTYAARHSPANALPAIVYPLLEATANVGSTYFAPGAVTLLFAVRGLRRPLAGGLNLFLGAIVLIGAIKAFGGQPVHALGSLPLLRMLAFPLYLTTPLLFAVSTVAALGFDDWWKTPRDSAAAWMWVALAPALLWIWRVGRGTHVLEPSIYAWALVATTLAVAAVGCVRWRTAAKRPLWSGLAVWALLACELGLHQTQIPWVPKYLEPAYFLGDERDQLRAEMKSGQRFALARVKVNAPMFLRLPGFDYDDYLQVRRYREFANGISDLWSLPEEEPTTTADLRLLGLASVDSVIHLGASDQLVPQDCMGWLARYGFRSWSGQGEPRFGRRAGGPVLTAAIPFRGRTRRLDLSSYETISLQYDVAGAITAPLQLTLSLAADAERPPLISEAIPPDFTGLRRVRAHLPPGRGMASLILEISGEQTSGVRLVVSDLTLGRYERLELDGPPRLRTPNFSVYSTGTAVPRAYVVHQAEVCDRSSILDALLDPAFDPVREIALEHEPPHPLPGADGPRSQARILESGAKRVTVEVAGERAGLLVLTDTYYPGWRASVDGEERPILAANLMFRAVPVEAGRHVVRFRYEPWSVRAGAALSLATSAVLAFLVVRARHGARSQGTG